MFRLKQFVLASLLALPSGALAFPSTPSERALLFADCAGSFAAQAEHFRHMGGALETAKERKEMFDLLLDAVTTDDMRSGDGAIRLRKVASEAEMFHGLLLTAATFAARSAHREPAEHAAQRRLAMCESLILGN